MIPSSAADTIAAIATPTGEGGIGIIRLSGPQAVGIAERVFRAKSGERVADQLSHTLRYGHLVGRSVSGHPGPVLDEAVLLLMRAPRSYTREDTVELCVHAGSAALSAALLRVLEEGARAAGPGEFTKRAFLNGRIDLVQAEAVLDLIRAKTDRSARWASAQLDGALSRRLRDIKQILLTASAHLEAVVDFPEDETGADGSAVVAALLDRARSAAEDLLSSSGIGLLVKTGAAVAIVGRPNVGKSSLLNRLVGRDRAIVTPIAGTTRDTIEDSCQIGGIPVRLLDTAGIQNTEHPIEKEGIDRSRRALSAADLVIYVVDASEPVDTQERQMLWTELAGRPVVVALNKCDLGIRSDPLELERSLAALGVQACSCKTGEGVAQLEAILYRALAGPVERTDEAVVSSVRQRDALGRICESLRRALDACGEGASPELVAADVRLALQDLGELVGEIVNDEILDVLFGQFCIGK